MMMISITSPQPNPTPTLPQTDKIMHVCYIALQNHAQNALNVQCFNININRRVQMMDEMVNKCVYVCWVRVS